MWWPNFKLEQTSKRTKAILTGTSASDVWLIVGGISPGLTDLINHNPFTREDLRQASGQLKSSTALTPNRGLKY